MHVFLSALAGLSVAGAALAPTLANTNRIKEQQTISPQAESYRISFGQHQELNVTQDVMSWSADFPFFANKPIDQLKFDSGSLVADVRWGSDRWVHSFPTIDIQQSQMGQWIELYRDEHTDFLATQTSWLKYRLSQISSGTNESSYRLELVFFAKADNTFTDCTGNLNIGSAMSVITNS